MALGMPAERGHAAATPQPAAPPSLRVARTPLGVVDRPEPIPARLRPLARSIVGSAPLPKISSGPLTQAALASAGAPAATTSGVVHLSTPSAADRPPIGLLAHELVHARTATTRPRFFGDTHVDSEERLARAVGAAADASAPTPAPAAEPTIARADPTPFQEREQPEGEGPFELPAEEAQLSEPERVPVDIDEIYQALEERILAELDRRGGRYAGVF